MRYKVKRGDTIILDEGVVEFEIDVGFEHDNEIIVNIHGARLVLEVTAGHLVCIRAIER